MLKAPGQIACYLARDCGWNIVFLLTLACKQILLSWSSVPVNEMSELIDRSNFTSSYNHHWFDQIITENHLWVLSVVVLVPALIFGQLLKYVHLLVTRFHFQGRGAFSWWWWAPWLTNTKRGPVKPFKSHCYPGERWKLPGQGLSLCMTSKAWLFYLMDL